MKLPTPDPKESSPAAILWELAKEVPWYAQDLAINASDNARKATAKSLRAYAANVEILPWRLGLAACVISGVVVYSVLNADLKPKAKIARWMASKIEPDTL